jgi:hypothetical protein
MLGGDWGYTPENPQVSGGLWGRRVSNLRPLACKTADPERHAQLQKRRSAASVIPTVIRCLNPCVDAL